MSSGMDKTLFNMKFTSKQLQRESQKAEKKSKEEGKKVLAAMQKGDMEIVKIHAGNAIRERTQAVNFMRLSSRIDAVAGRVETAIRMNALTKQIGAVTNGMDAVLGTMDVDRIGRMMDNFEKQFDSLDVRSGYMESAIAHSTASAVPQEQVDEFIKMMQAQNAVEFKDSLAVGASGAVGPYGVGASAGASSAAPREAVAAGVPPPAAAAPAPAPGAGGAQPPAGPPAGGSGSDVADSLAARLAALRSSR